MKELVDERNIDLWKRILKNFTVDFRDSDNSVYRCYAKGNQITFFIGQGKICKDSFTHEMFHIYFRLNECYFGAGLSNILLSNNRFGKILTSELIEHEKAQPRRVQ